MKRRTFLRQSAGAAAAIALAPQSLFGDSKDPIGHFEPFLDRSKLPDPVRIASIDLFKRAGNYFVRVRSQDGAEGWAVSHPSVMGLCFPVFLKVVVPSLIGKDARDLDRLLDEVYLGTGAGSHYKMQGQLLWVAVASAELALLDLLGKVANQSAANLLGGAKRKQIDLYIANNHRSRDPEESLRRIVASVDRIQARAVKFKIGGRMKVVDQVPGRTKALIPKVAEALGDRCTIYADANSSYVDVQEAIEVGRMLQDNGIAFYEEPCPFDYLHETSRVARALEIPVAWGEQESSQWRFRWMVKNSGVRIFQPDLFYYGGLIRSLRVAKMAEARGLDCTPHISGGGLGFLYMGIYAACCPNPGAFQEYKGLHKAFPWESSGTPIRVEQGSMTAPDGPGIGVTIDPEFLRGADPVILA